MEQEILQKVSDEKNIILVGRTDSGKSHFVKHLLIPFLESNNFKVSYFENCDKLELADKCDIYIVDEVEILFDKIFLENKHSAEKPYYSKEYLKKVESWQKKLVQIDRPVICIVTRNNDNEIDNLILNYKSLEWNNLLVEVIKFEK